MGQPDAMNAGGPPAQWGQMTPMGGMPPTPPAPPMGPPQAWAPPRMAQPMALPDFAGLPHFDTMEQLIAFLQKRTKDRMPGSGGGGGEPRRNVAPNFVQPMTDAEREAELWRQMRIGNPDWEVGGGRGD